MWQLSPFILFVLLSLLPLPADARSPAEGASLVPLNADLQLCGSGVLEVWGFLEVGHSFLYRPDCSRTWDLFLSEVRYMEFRYDRAIPAEAFRESALTLLVRQGFGDSPALEAFHQAYRDAKAGDTYALYYSPEAGLALYLNGTHLGTLSDPVMAEAYFAIWLGHQPFDEDLKTALLGKKSR